MDRSRHTAAAERLPAVRKQLEEDHQAALPKQNREPAEVQVSVHLEEDECWSRTDGESTFLEY